MIQIYRIVKSNYALTAFDGEGARLYGGRWNHEGTPLIYTSESLALAALELFVQLDVPPKTNLVTITANIPLELRVDTLAKLPENWEKYPANSCTQDLGTTWSKNRNAVVLKVPSAIIPTEYNYLLNPLHPDFKKIIINKPLNFSFDQRLWKA